MPDQITQAEREAIARYTGPVRVIPRGVSALAEYAEKPRMTIREGETRRQTVRRLAKEGRTMRDIGSFLGISHNTAARIAKGLIE